MEWNFIYILLIVYILFYIYYTYNDSESTTQTNSNESNNQENSNESINPKTSSEYINQLNVFKNIKTETCDNTNLLNQIKKSIYNHVLDISEQINNIINADLYIPTPEVPINSDGFDNVQYNYTPNLIEGFDNLNIQKIYPIMNVPRNIWVYWQNINRTTYPTIIKLCLDTIKKHLGSKYNLIILNENTIKKYLPDIRDDFDNLMVAQKVDYYRIALLYKYGGIWLDADIIVMKDLAPIFEKLDEGYDFVGFGCTGNQCSNGYFRPSNWVLGARPNSVLMKTVLDKLDEKLNNREKNIVQNDETYHDYGKIVIWNALDDLKLTGYDYFHFTSEYDGTRDENQYWLHTPEYFDKTPKKLLDESKVLFMVLYNSEINGNESLQWVKDSDENKLIYSDLWISSLFRKALGIV
jgi:hypothetical protein